MPGHHCPPHPHRDFDAIYGLNLDRRPERWQRLCAQLAKHGLTAERFPATDGRSPAVQAEFQRLRELRSNGLSPDPRTGLPNPGALGCVLSYLRLVEDAQSRGLRRILIFEDDAALHRNFLDEYRKRDQLPADWKLLYLGCSQYRWEDLRSWNDGFYHAQHSAGSFAWGLDASLFDEFLGLLRARAAVVDECLQQLQCQYRDGCFVFQPNLAVADVADSDIRPARDPIAHARVMRWNLNLYDVPYSLEESWTAHQDRQKLEQTAAALPACPARHVVAWSNDRFFCAHPQVHIKHQLVPATVCRACRVRSISSAEYRTVPDHPPGQEPRGTCLFLGEPLAGQDGLSAERQVYSCRHLLHPHTTLAACRRCPDFEAVLSDRTVATWAVGVTTAPRRQATLARTLKSLTAAGWERPHLFAEPGVSVPDEWSHLPVTVRKARLGIFGNWYLALAELVLLHPRADAYFLCQDDVVFCRNLRIYLEQELWPASRVGVVSVYCPSHYGWRQGFGFHAEDRGWETWGALAYILPNASARALLAHPAVLNHRLRGPLDGKYNLDSVVGQWCRALELPYFVHAPSLAQHIGETSTVYAAAQNADLRSAATFLGEETDVVSLRARHDD